MTHTFQVYMSLSAFPEFFGHIVTKIRSQPNDSFKNCSLKFLGVANVKDLTKQEEKPNFKYKNFSEIFKRYDSYKGL